MAPLKALNAFLRWWWGQLGALAPESIRRLSERRVDSLVLSLTRDAMRVDSIHDGHVDSWGSLPRNSAAPGAGQSESTGPNPGEHDRISARLAGLDPRNTRIIVRLEAADTLRKVLTLPGAAAENLRQVLSYEMNRQTPFKSEDVYFDYKVSAGREARTIDVELLLAPKRLLSDALDLVGHWDPRATENGFAATRENAGLDFTFLPAAYRPDPGGRLVFGLAAANLVLFIALVAGALYRQSTEIAELSDRLDELRTEAAELQEIQQALDGRAAELRSVANEKLKYPPAVEVINEVSTRFDDLTWLKRLDIKNGEVQLQGSSASAATLIGELEQSELFHSVSFTSPVTRNAGTGREDFRITAKLTTPASGS